MTSIITVLLSIASLSGNAPVRSKADSTPSILFEACGETGAIFKVQGIANSWEVVKALGDDTQGPSNPEALHTTKFY